VQRPPISGRSFLPLPRDDDWFSLPSIWLARYGFVREKMMRGDAEARRLANRLSAVGGLVLALSIFSLDVQSPLQGAVAVLYTTVVLAIARDGSRTTIIASGSVCAILALLAYGISHGSEPLGAAAMRLTMSLIAITITTILSVRHQGAAEQSRRADGRYRAIFDSAGFPIWEVDGSVGFALFQKGQVTDDLIEHGVRNAQIRDINQAGVEMFKAPNREAMVGRSVLDHYTPAGQTSLGKLLRRLHAGETTLSEETQFVTLSGETIDVILRLTLPPDHDGWKHMLIMAFDVTDQVRTQARLDQSQAELAHVSRVSLLGQLAASIAHEVNQPLSAIITYAKSGRRWLARAEPDVGEVEECLDHIALNSTRAADVIARIQDLARKADPKLDHFELGPLIDESVALLRRDLQSHDVAIRTAIAPGLPPVFGDRVQLQQVLMNLMLNADQAMIHVPPERRLLQLDAAADGSEMLVSVRDRGVGIAASAEELFSPFFTTKADGMGMGLSICRSIIERHGGRLTADSDPEGGAVFTFHLPITATAPGGVL